MKEYFKNNILSSKDYEQALSFTFGTFYIPFLNETKYEYLQAVYNMNKCENPDTLFCPGMPELILSRLHARLRPHPHSRNEHVQSRRKAGRRQQQ